MDTFLECLRLIGIGIFTNAVCLGAILVVLMVHFLFQED